jgi:hypothetical protein
MDVDEGILTEERPLNVVRIPVWFAAQSAHSAPGSIHLLMYAWESTGVKALNGVFLNDDLLAFTPFSVRKS